MVTNLTQSFVDSMASLVVNRTYDVWGQMLQNGTPHDLTGHTVTAKIRQLRVPTAIIGSGTYEALPVTPGNDETAAVFGGMSFTVFLDAADFHVPVNPTDTEPYFIEYYDADDDYTPQRVLIYLARVY